MLRQHCIRVYAKYEVWRLDIWSLSADFWDEGLKVMLFEWFRSIRFKTFVSRVYVYENMRVILTQWADRCQKRLLTGFDASSTV